MTELTAKKCNDVWHGKSKPGENYSNDKAGIVEHTLDCVKIGRIELFPDGEWEYRVANHIEDQVLNERLNKYEILILKLTQLDDSAKKEFVKSQEDWKTYSKSTCRLESRFSRPWASAGDYVSWGGESGQCYRKAIKERIERLERIFTLSDQQFHQSQ